MRVLQVSAGPLSGPGAGGAERLCRDLSCWLESAGTEVGIVAPAGDRESPFAVGRPLRPARWKLLRKLLFDYVSPANTRLLRRTLDVFRPDVVHLHNIYGIGSQLVRVAAEAAPTVVTMHDYWPIDVFVPRFEQGQPRYPRRHALAAPWVWAHRVAHRRNVGGAAIVSPSRYLAERLKEHGYEDIRVIPNGIALPQETAQGESSVLFVGRLAPEKGLANVLPSLSPVASEIGWDIDVVGDGPPLEQLRSAYPSVRFHGRADAAAFYQRASVVVLPSQWPENFPYVALEAMAHGVPVIASRVGGIPEIVEDHVSGLLCEPDQPYQFGEALRSLAADRDLRERLGRAGRERIARDLTWDSIGPQYMSLYEQLAPSAARPAARAG